MTGTGLNGIPPGRAGRGWLHRRLRTAQRGRDQLDRKMRILLPERRRLDLVLDRHQHEWSEACLEARTWLRRAALLGGEDSIRTAGSCEPVSITVRWASTMGVTYPADIEVIRGDREPDRLLGNAAVNPARTAVWRMVEAGGRLAAAEESLRRMDAEIGLTRRRLRALDQRWLPRFTDALRTLELNLEQVEQEEGIRLRHSGREGPGKGVRRVRPDSRRG
jgi:V/A-type H+-transporting ATPase subunit D